MAGPSRRSLLVALVTLAAMAVAAAPAVVAFGLGWMSLGWESEEAGIGRLADPNPIEAWVLLALAFLVWVPLVLVGLIWALDRLGHHYTPVDRQKRPSRRERRRRRAALKYGEGVETARREAEHDAARRRAARRAAGGDASRRTSDGDASRRPPSGDAEV
jgi:hypothetical protein